MPLPPRAAGGERVESPEHQGSLCVLSLSLVRFREWEADGYVAIDHGVNDPVAHKILASHAASSGLAAPADASIARSLPLLSSFANESTSTDLPLPLLPPSHRNRRLDPSLLRPLLLLSQIRRPSPHLARRLYQFYRPKSRRRGRREEQRQGRH